MIVLNLVIIYVGYVINVGVRILIYWFYELTRIFEIIFRTP